MSSPESDFGSDFLIAAVSADSVVFDDASVGSVGVAGGWGKPPSASLRGVCADEFALLVSPAIAFEGSDVGFVEPVSAALIWFWSDCC